MISPDHNEAHSNASSEFDDSLSLFQEPEGFYKPAPSISFAEHTLLSGESLRLRLVGHSPLWGHYLWNAGRVLAEYLEKRADTLVKGKTVLELGAGAGLPSMVCARKGALKVLVTDYPDADLIENLAQNIELTSAPNCAASGYLWGADPVPLLSQLPSPATGFDVLLLSDLLFNHSEHRKLVDTVKITMKKIRDAVALVFFTPHRPWLYEKDMAFFDVVKEEGLEVEKIFEHVMDAPMFEEDRGDREKRRTVYGFVVKWPKGV